MRIIMMLRLEAVKNVMVTFCMDIAKRMTGP
jgi:hypothetical protein